MDTLKLLNWARAYLRDNYIENPDKNAEMLLCFALGCRRIDLYLGDIEVNGERSAFKELIKKRVQGAPLQYLTGFTDFMGFKFNVCPGVFIPRPETELLVEETLHVVNMQPNTLRTLRCNITMPEESFCDFAILDFGTGSGNIAISLTKFITNCKITAIDSSDKAIALAEQNAGIHNVSDRIVFSKKTIWNLQTNFDIIVSNPPYITTKDLGGLPPEVKCEPEAALDGGRDGMDFHRQLIRYSINHLKDKGFLIMEIGEGQAEGIKDLLDSSGLRLQEIRKDYNHIERIAIIQNG